MVHFDVSGVDLTNSTLVKAEFRIFRAPNPQARASEQRVEIYQVTQQDTVEAKAAVSHLPHAAPSHLSGAEAR